MRVGGVRLETAENYIGSLLDKYGNTILRLAYTYLKNQADAEDVVQDVFLSIIEKQPVFNDETHEKSWIIRAAINTCKDRLKLYWNKNKCSIDDIGEISSNDTYNIDSTILDAVMSLSEKYRIVVYMFYYEEYSTPEIARLIGKSEVTVRSLLHRARKQLKIMLKEEYDFEREI